MNSLPNGFVLETQAELPQGFVIEDTPTEKIIRQEQGKANQRMMQHAKPMSAADALKTESFLRSDAVNLADTIGRYKPWTPDRAEAAAPMTFGQVLLNKVMGSQGSVTPKSSAQALIAFEAGQQGMTPKKFVEQVGARTGLAERATKDIGAGVMASAAGMLGYAAKKMDESPAVQELFDRADIKAQQMMPADPVFIDQLLSGFGSQFLFFVPGLGIAQGVRAAAMVAPRMAAWMGASASAGMEAAAEAGTVYQQMLAKGAGKDEAARAAERAFWSNAPLLVVTNKLGLFGNKGGKLMRHSLSAVMEGSQEGAQQVISNLSTGQPAGEGVAESTAIGAIVGGGIGGIVNTPVENLGQQLQRRVEGARMTNPQTIAAQRLQPSQILPDGFVVENAAPIDQQKSEQRIVQPVAESQAPATSEPGDAGVAPGLVGGAPSSMFTPKTTATHQDIGEAPETVTPGVVSDAISKAPIDYKTAKKNLLAEVDAAIKTAGDHAVLPIYKGAKPNEAAIKAAGFITFAVPGDGKFKVVNSRDTLRRFRERVFRSAAFSKPKGTAPKQPFSPGSAATTVHEFLEEGDLRNAYELARLTNMPLRYATNSKGVVNPMTGAVDVEIDGFRAFVGRVIGEKTWSVTEPDTGYSLGKGKTREKAIQDATDKITQLGKERVGEIIENSRESAASRGWSIGQDAMEKRFLAQLDQGDGSTVGTVGEVEAKTEAAEESGESTAPFYSKQPAQEGSAIEKMAPGASYVGFIDQNYEPGVEAPALGRGKPIRREDILIPFLKALNIPLYQGRVKGRGMERVLGYYVPHREAVRIRRRGDLEVAAHEIAHLIDDRLWRIKGKRRGNQPWGKRRGNQPWIVNVNAKTYANELRSVSYDESKVYEGFAEYVRHWMTRPDVARDRAPEFTKYWEKLVSSHPYGKAIKDAQKGMMAWYAQSLTDRARSKIGGDASVDVIADANKSIKDEIRQGVFDDLHGVFKMEQFATGMKEAEALGPYETARMIRAAESIVDGALHWGVPKRRSRGDWVYVDRNGNPDHIIVDGKSLDNPHYKSWGLRDVFAPVSKDLEEWKLYAAGRRSNELMKQGRQKRFTQAEIDAMIDLGRGKPHFAEVFADFQKWNKGILNFAQDMGVVNPDQRAQFESDEYIPLNVIMEEGKGGTTKRKGGVEGNVKVIHRLKGSDRQLNDVVDNIVMNARRLIAEGIKNQARLEVIDYAMKMPGGGKFLASIPTDSKTVGIDKRQVEAAVIKSMTGLTPGQYRAMQEIGQGIPELDMVLDNMSKGMEDFVKFMMFNQSPRGDDVVAVLRDGNLEFYQIADPYLYRSFAAFNRKHSRNGIVRALSAIRRIGQSSITLTFSFMGANIWRDTWNAFTISKHGFVPILDSLRGIKSRVTRDATYRAFIANGAGMSSYLIDPEEFQFHVRHFYSKNGIDAAWVLNTPRRMLIGLEIMADAIEQSTRLGEMHASLRRGSQPRHAAFSAREISVDFMMRGDNKTLNLLYDTVLFLKAGVVSMDRMYRAGFKGANRKDVWLRSGMIALASSLLYAINRGNPDYDDLKDWDKDMNWHFFFPTADPDNDFHLRLPKMWEVGAISTTAEKVTAALMDAQEEKLTPEQAKKYAFQAGKAWRDLFYLGSIPAGFEPLIEVYWKNKNEFTGSDIVPEGRTDLTPFAQYSPYTNKTLIALAEKTATRPPLMQFSPARSQALIEGYLHTWGMIGLQIMDQTLYGDKLPEPRSEQHPIYGRFVRETPPRNTQAASDFWEFFKESESLIRTMRAMDKELKPDIAEHYAEMDEVAMARSVSKVADKARAITDEMVRIRDDDILTPAEKKAQIKELQREKNALFKDAMESIEGAKQ